MSSKPKINTTHIRFSPKVKKKHQPNKYKENPNQESREQKKIKKIKRPTKEIVDDPKIHAKEAHFKQGRKGRTLQ